MGVLSAGIISKLPTAVKVLDKLACTQEMGKGVMAMQDMLRHNAKDLWSHGKKGHFHNIIKHWNDHKNDFPHLKTEYEYVKATWNFLTNPPAGTLTKTAKGNGNTLKFHPDSRVFGVIEKNTGLPTSMFKLDPFKGKSPLERFNDM